MISELKDDEILDFLMTSDFEEDYKPDELKYLLVKFRYFYRVLYSKNNNDVQDGEFIIKKLQEEIESLKSSVFSVQKESADKQNSIDLLKSRKLSLKERLTGKIIHKDEN